MGVDYLQINIIAVYHTKASSPRSKLCGTAQGLNRYYRSVLSTVDVTTIENTNYLPKQSSSVAAVAQRGTLPQHPWGQPAIFYSFLFACFKCWGKIKGWNDEIKMAFTACPSQRNKDINKQNPSIFPPPGCSWQWLLKLPAGSSLFTTS